MSKTRSRLAIEKPLIQLFIDACSLDKYQRALDIASLLLLPASLRAVLNIATQRRLTELAERLSALVSSGR